MLQRKNWLRFAICTQPNDYRTPPCLPSSFALTWGYIAQPNARPHLLVGRNENNPSSLERLLNSNQSFNHGSKTILKSADGIGRNACPFSQVAHAPTQGRPGHSDLYRRNQSHLRRGAPVDNNIPMEYIVLQNW